MTRWNDDIQADLANHYQKDALRVRESFNLRFWNDERRDPENSPNYQVSGIRDRIRHQAGEAMDAISADIQRFWAILHPDVPIENVSGAR